MPGVNKRQSARRWWVAFALAIAVVLGSTLAILGAVRLLRTEYECEEGVEGADSLDQYCSCIESKDAKKLACTRKYSCCLALEPGGITFMDHDRPYVGPKRCRCDNGPVCESLNGYMAKPVDHCPETD